MDFESMVCISLLLVRAKRRLTEENCRKDVPVVPKEDLPIYYTKKNINLVSNLKGSNISSLIVPARKRRRAVKSDEDISVEVIDDNEKNMENEVKTEPNTENKNDVTKLVEAKSLCDNNDRVETAFMIHEEFIVKEEIDVEYTTNITEEEFINVRNNRGEDREKLKPDIIQPYKYSDYLTKAHFYTKHYKLRETPELFYNYYHMSINTFDELLTILQPRISRKETNMRKPISPEVRLSVTLRYLSTGNGCHLLHKEYLLGSSTIYQIVRQTCREIWNALKDDYLPPKNPQSWLKIANEFYNITNFPNCIGAIDGRQLRVKVPASPDRQRKWSSILLLGLIDANYCFIDIEMINDISLDNGNVFRNSNILKKLNAGKLKIPRHRKFPNDENGSEMPFVFVGDESLAISGNIMRPYSRRDADISKITFNQRLLKARQMSDRAFNILGSKWKILNRSINSKPENARDIIKSVCILHNFIMRRDFEIVLKEKIDKCRLRGAPSFGTGGTCIGKENREYFAKYFTMHPE